MSFDDSMVYLFLLVNLLVLILALVFIKQKKFLRAYIAAFTSLLLPSASSYIVQGLEKLFCPIDTCDISGQCTCYMSEFAISFGWTMIHSFFLFAVASLLVLLVISTIHGYHLFKAEKYKNLFYVITVGLLVMCGLVFSAYQIATFSL